MVSRFPLSILVSTAAAIWALILAGNGWIIPVSFFQPLSAVIGALSLLLLAFDWWIWAWPGIRLFTKRPDLRGTWKGVLQSTWAGDERESGLGMIHAYLMISQTHTGLHLRLFTQESQSGTLVAALKCEADGHYVLSALYRNQPRHLVRARSSIHHGALLLDLRGERFDGLEGSYWTDRKTDGEMRFRRVSRERSRDFEAADTAFSSIR